MTACEAADECRTDRRCSNYLECQLAGVSQMDADDLSSMSVAIAHCGQPMRYRNSTTTWQGAPGQGTEITTTIRVCDCGAELVATFRKPA